MFLWGCEEEKQQQNKAKQQQKWKKMKTSEAFTVCIHINYTCQHTWGSVENEENITQKSRGRKTGVQGTIILP